MCNFSEALNTGYHPIPHCINAKNYVNCSHCNALKLSSESSKMCSYNFAFTFTSTGAKLDNNLANAQNGVYTYCVQGFFYYSIGFLLPENDIEPQYLQMYVWDMQHKLDHRTNVIPNSGLNPALIQSLKTILDEVNSYMINLRYISRLPTKNIANLAILIHADIPGLNLRTFNELTTSQIVAIWVDTEIPSDMIQNCDIVLYTKMDKLIHISEISICYNPLAYPILFLYDKQGWSPYKIPYKTLLFEVIDSTIDENSHNEEDKEDKRNIQEYEIHENATELENSNEPPNNDEDFTIENNNAINSNISTKRHKKFFLVNMYVKIESDRLNFLRFKQKKIRSDLYKGIQDAVMRGDSDPTLIWHRNAMALLSVGRPDLFITTTCNPNWLEIQSLLLPGQQAQDRPNIT
ncbi:21308_t:CDS:2, partial [Gigaspora margarita]